MCYSISTKKVSKETEKQFKSKKIELKSLFIYLIKNNYM